MKTLASHNFVCGGFVCLAFMPWGNAYETVSVCKLNLVQKTFPQEKEILVSSKSHYFDKTDLSRDMTI